VLLGHRAEEAVVHVVEALLVDLEELEGGGRDLGVGLAAGALEGVVARRAFGPWSIMMSMRKSSIAE